MGNRDQDATKAETRLTDDSHDDHRTFDRLSTRYISATVAALLILSVLPATGLQAAVFTVDSTSDATDVLPGDGACDDGSGACTLRAAVMEANSLSGIETVNLPAGTYALSIAGSGEDAAATGDLDITEDLTLTGAGSATTVVDGGTLDAVFHTDPLMAGVTVEISGIAIQNGSSTHVYGGGGVLNRGELTLTDCIVRDSTTTNNGGGIASWGSALTLTNCSVNGNSSSSGGGVYNGSSSTMTVTGTTIDGNMASSQGGGGIANWGSAAITSSVISANNSSGAAGILHSGTTLTIDDSSISGNIGLNYAGGLEVSGGTVTVTGSTIASNQGAHAVRARWASTTLSLVNSTVSGNYGGLYNGGAVKVEYSAVLNLRNATIARNTGPTSMGAPAAGGVTNNDGVVNMRNSLIGANTSATGQPDCLGILNSEGYNLVGSLNGCSITGDTTGNITSVNPRVLTLADNGGATMTVALGTKSPAIDSANPAVPGSGGTACAAADQRGIARPVDGDGDGAAQCDMGAYEAHHEVFTFTVNATDDTDDGTCDPAHCSLREAILASNATSTGVDTIAFDIPGAGPHIIQPTSVLPNITDPAIIDGYTQPGASANTNGPDVGSNAVLKVEIDGSAAGTGVSGLKTTAGYTTIRGLAITRYVRSGATGGNGIELWGSTDNVVEGCFIGTDVTGTIDRGNQTSGVYLYYGSRATIGGLVPAARNIISGNDSYQVMILGSNHTVHGNFIGPDATGTSAIALGGMGIRFAGGSSNLVGGETIDARNLISGGGTNIKIEGSTSDTVIQGNFIGPDVSGTASIGSYGGISMAQQASGTLIGGPGAGQGNLISGNTGTALAVGGDFGSETIVQGNLIGTAADGVSPLGNGVAVGAGGTAGVVLGGTGPGEQNTIAFNGVPVPPFGPTPAITMYTGSGLDIRANRIFSNQELAIDLGNDDVTANDPGDGDTGPNGLQNYPVLSTVTAGGATIGGSLDSTASTTFRVDFYASLACDPSGFGEGGTYLGSDTVTTDGSGMATINSTVTTPVPSGTFVTAIATDPGGNSSEFSACLEYDPGFVNLGIENGDGGATTAPGATVAYTLGYTNVGSLAATGVVLTDTVPAATTFNAAGSTPGWACSPDVNPGSICTLAIGTVGSGSGGSATFVVDVANPVAAGVDQLANTASIADDGAAGPDPDPSDNTDTDTTPVDAVPDLAIVKDDGGATAVPDGDASYTLSYTNNGNQGATGVVLTDTVPADTTFNTAASTAGWACVPDNNPGSVCTFPVGDLAGGGAGGAVAFVVTVVNPVATGIEEISNTASVVDDGANGADPTPADNTDGDITPVDAAPDLAIVKDDGGALPPSGGDLVYTLTVTNYGNQESTGIELTDTVPVGTTFNPAASAAGWSCIPDNNAGSVCTLVMGDLTGGGADMSADFAATIDDPLPAGTTEITNTASVEDDGANGVDPDPSDNSDTEVTDAIPPAITGVDTIADTGDGRLDECETAHSMWISKILVSFSEPLHDPPGHTDPDDVTNPANYQLISPGPDHQIDTAVCGSLTGDDIEVPIAGVAYDAPSATATLDTGNLLPSQLRLLVCGAAGLRDLSGRLLDGTGDGVGGDDFSLTFRADPTNRLANGHFDCTLDGWTVVETVPGAVAWSPEDAEGSPLSGSAGIANLTPTGAAEVFSLEQCAPLDVESISLLAQRIRLSADPGEFFQLDFGCEFYRDPDCLGAHLGTASRSIVVQDTTGVWAGYTVEAAPPATTDSVRCGATLSTGSAGPVFTAEIDMLSFEVDAPLFDDGFESGDTSRWSLVIP